MNIFIKELDQKRKKQKQRKTSALSDILQPSNNIHYFHIYTQFCLFFVFNTKKIFSKSSFVHTLFTQKGSIFISCSLRYVLECCPKIGLMPEQFCIEINQFFEMSSFEVSHERISDGRGRIYSCFCDRIFTTYPGLYLHLKSKHANIFQKYKKLKITKLFQKIRGENGRQVHRLKTLYQRQNTHHRFNQKKFKNQKKNVKSFFCRSLQPEEQQSSVNHRKTRDLNMPTLRSHEKIKNERMLTLVSSESSAEVKLKQGLQEHRFVPYPRAFNAHQIFNSYNYARFNTPTVKKLLQAYLSESQELDKKALKNALYNVMVFLDKNYQHLRDPRCQHVVFLSYCDIFDHHFVGPMLQEYIRHFGLHIQEARQEQATEGRRQLQHLLLFAKWLKRCSIMDLHIEQLSCFNQQEIAVQSRLKLQRVLQSDVDGKMSDFLSIAQKNQLIDRQVIKDQ